MWMVRRALLAALAGRVVHTAQAQSVPPYPRGPVRLIVPYVPGGATDIQARALAHRLGIMWGQTVLVENRPGGNTVVATEVVARAPPDGHTLLVAAMPFALNPSMYDRLPYDSERDIAPVSLISQVPLALIVNKDLPVRTVTDLVAMARARPGQMSFGSPGIGATPHLAGEMLCSQAGLEMVHVPYRGGAAIHADLLGGRIPMVFDTGAWGLIAQGQVRPLAVTTAQRVASLPNVPTMIESGFPNFTISAWHGVMTTGATPPDLVTWLSAQIAEALRQEDVAARFDALAAQRVGSTPEECRRFIAGEQRRFATLIRERNIRPES
jgi:tripartite-type tricarboxylate transporter receptor subunit TctC